MSDLIERQVRYKQLARKLAERSIVTDALARLLEQVIAEVHDSRIEPQAARIAELEAEVARLRPFLWLDWSKMVEHLSPASQASVMARVERARAALAAPDTGGAE